MQTSPRLPRFSLRKQEALTGLLLLLPSLVIILGITLQPVISTFYLSFFEASLGRGENIFRGLGNYRDLLADPMFWTTIGRTFYFTLVSVGLEVVIGLGMALLINSHPPGWRALRTALIIPWAVPTIVNGTMWRWIYNADYGALNGLLMQLGLINHYVPWLIYPRTAMNLVIRSVEAFRVFDIIYVITAGGPAFGTVTISYLTYLETFSFGHVGRGSALSFLISLFTLAMAFIYIRFLYRPEERY
jgi:ABC-type sugar transport system permease subunit